MIKAVIFDFDGVIINSHDVQKRALVESFEIVVGKGQPSVEEFFTHSGDSLENIFRKMNLPLEMVHYYKKISKDNLNLIKVYEGIGEILGWIKRNNLLCAICTGKDKYRTIEILNFIGYSDFFDFVICSDEVENPKPNPESLLIIKNHFNVMSDEVIMIGDGKNDIICANRAGVESIAVTWGDGLKDELVKENPTFVADEVSQLQGIIQSKLSK